jgi:Ca2+-binding RTX toxin-like protein
VSLDVLNTAPTARGDSFTAVFGSGVVGNLLRNNGAGADSDADGDALSVTRETRTTAQGGTVAIREDGVFRYTPPEAFYGTDSFSYTVTDGFGGTATATAIITTPAPAGAIFGTAANNNINGTAVNDFIFSLAGDDIINGLGGHDLLAGGADKDTLSGGGGHDKLYGQAGRDVLQGNAGNDSLSGGLDVDELSGGDGNDRLLGGAGIDELAGGAGFDQFVFDRPTGQSFDRISDFTTGDQLCVIGREYRLAAGTLPDASYFANGAAANVDHGRFVYSAVNRSLSWDADGNAATANRVIAIFDSPVSLSYTDFLIL